MGIIIRRVKISEVREGKIKRFDAEGLGGEPFTDREFFQQFGITSKPRADAEGIVIGRGNVFFMIASDDRDNRPALADDGDVAVHSNKDTYILIKDSGKIVVMGSDVELGDGTLRKLIDERLVTKLNDFITNDHNGHMHPTAATGPPSVPSVPAATITLADVATSKTTGS